MKYDICNEYIKLNKCSLNQPIIISDKTAIIDNMCNGNSECKTLFFTCSVCGENKFIFNTNDQKLNFIQDETENKICLDCNKTKELP